MPLTLIFRATTASVAQEVTFDAPRVVIGRSEGSDLRLPDPSVSHRHASIRQRGRDYIVMDEGSTNGTFVGPVKLSPGAPRVLNSGDRIRLGRVTLDTQITAQPPTAQGAQATKEIALALVGEMLSSQGEVNAPVVEVISGADSGKTLLLTEFQRTYILGRVNTADLVLDDNDASRRHISIVRRADQLLVRDLSSKNGTLLAGVPLEAEKDTVWAVDAALTIGSDVFNYTDPVREALRELEHAPDEALSASEMSEVSSAATTADASPVAVANAPARAPRPQRARSTASGWGASDFLVALLALAVLAISALGLYWLWS
ncbi:MAG TPA: FHA domain-containing protein [Polyangiaceae bacterium]|nr:FHA domain-containing protein [Polyangiaceae bacterium]